MEYTRSMKLAELQHCDGTPLRDTLLRLARELGEVEAVCKKLETTRQTLMTWRVRLGISLAEWQIALEEGKLNTLRRTL